MTDERHDIHRYSSLGQAFQVTTEGPPRHIQLVLLRHAGAHDRIALLAQRGRRGATVADDLSRHALMHFTFRHRIDQEGVIGVGVEVDKTGGHYQSRAIDNTPRLWLRYLTHLGDEITTNGDVGDERWRSAT